MNKRTRYQTPKLSADERADAKARADAWALKLRAALSRGASVEEMDAIYMEAGR